ncbi:MAG TPA: rod shape-determining protein MreC [Candidatus Paceibacterota bacterium]
MSYRHSDLNIKERGARNKRFWLSFSVTVLVVVLIIVITPIRKGFTRGVMSVSELFWQGKLIALGDRVEETIRFKKGIVAENRSLKEELVKNEAIRVENKSLKEENTLLRSLLDSVPDDTRITLSTILSRPSNSPFDTFIISGGEDKSYSVGNLVYGTEFVVLGKVAEVYNKTSKVVLFSSYKVETPILVGPENITLSAVGHGGQNFSIELPEGLGVTVGDTLLLPTIRHAVIGTVGEIKPNPDGTTRTVIARSPINMYQLRFVMVSEETINQ